MSTDPTPSPTWNRLVTAIRQSVPRPLATQAIAPEHRLRDDLGLDSLGLMTLAALLEDALDLELSPHTERLALATTAGQLDALLRALGAR
jgi:acyl carrier protein